MIPIPGGLNAGVLKAFITADTKGLTTGLTRASAQITQFANQTQVKMASVNAAFVGMGKAFVGANLIVGAALAVSVSRFAKFDKAMKQSTAVSKVTATQYKLMSKMAEKTSIELNMAADKTARAFYFLGSAGLKAEEQIQSFVATNLLAKAGVMEVGRSAEILVDTMKGFKIPFTETLAVADKLTVGFTSSNQTMEQMGESLSYAAGVSRAFNNDLSDTIAVLGFYADIGVKGSRAGTTLRRSLINLAAPTSKMREELEKYVDVYDQATGKMRPFIEIIADFTDAISNVSEEQRNMAIKTIFGARAINGMIGVIDRGGDALRTYRDEIRGAGGDAQRVADIQMSAFSEQLGKTFKILDDIVRAVGELAVNELAGGIDNINKKLGEFNTRLKENNDDLVIAMKNLVDYVNFWGTVFKYISKALRLIGLNVFTTFNMMRLAITQFVIFVKDSFKLISDAIIFAFEAAWIGSKAFFENWDTAMNMLLDFDFEGLQDLMSKPFGEVSELAQAKFALIESDAKILANNMNLIFTQMKDQIIYSFDEMKDILGFGAAAGKEKKKTLGGSGGSGGAGGTVEEGVDPAFSLATPDIWGAIAESVKKAGQYMVKFNKESTVVLTDMQKSFRALGFIIKESIGDTLADVFMGAKVSAKDFFDYIIKQALKKGIMMILSSIFPATTPLGFLGLTPPGGEHGGLFQNYGGRINIPSFAGGVSGYQIPPNIGMDTLPVMVGGGEELDVRSIGQVSDRDNLLKLLNNKMAKLIKAVYETEAKFGDVDIRKANNRGKRIIGEY